MGHSRGLSAPGALAPESPEQPAGQAQRPAVSDPRTDCVRPTAVSDPRTGRARQRGWRGFQNRRLCRTGVMPPQVVYPPDKPDYF